MKRISFVFFLSLFVSALFAADSTFTLKTSDGVNLYVRVAGTGQPCLFVHGGPGSTANYFEVLPSAKTLERSLRMVYYDQRGSGRSDSAANRDYSLQRMTMDMDELRRHLGIGKWAVMGHSFAGILLTDYAKRFPQNISSLLYIHCTVNMQASMQSHIDFGKRELGLQNDPLLNDESKPVLQRVSVVHDKLSEKNLWYKLMYRNAEEKRYNDSITLAAGRFNRDFAAQCWNIADYWQDHAPKTAAIACPVLVMTGEADYAIGVDHYKRFRFPRQTVVHYNGGHAPFQEEPQWFANAVLRFMAAVR